MTDTLDMSRSRKQRASAPLLLEASATLGLLLVMMAYLFAVVPGYYSQSQGGDFPYYVQLAEAPLTHSVPSPWRYRPLNPFLASLLIAAGIPTNAAFLMLTFMFAFGSCLLMRIYLRQLGLSLYAARAGTLLFAVSVGGFIPLRRYYGYTDTLTNFFILLVLVSVAARRHLATAAALAVGTLAKESLLLLLPFLAARLHAVRVSLAVAGAVLAAPVAVFLLLRLMIGPDAAGTSSVALTWDAQVEYWRTAMVHGVGRWILWAFAYSMGPVWVLAAIAAPRQWTFVRSCALLLLPLLVPLLRTTDTERALMLAFPVVFPLAAHALQSLRESRHAVSLAALAIACTFAAQLTFDWSPEMRLGVVNAKDAVFVVLCLTPIAPLLGAPWRQPDSRLTFP